MLSLFEYNVIVIQLKSMKLLLFASLILILGSCRQQAGNEPQLQKRLDSLGSAINNMYKPGLGEFMSNIQVHHEKLWFAGRNKNWELADFEINEIKESLDDIKKFCKDRPETKSIEMIDQPLQNVSNTIQQRDGSGFKNSYITFTTTCNNCHKETHHGFNVITIPSTPPFSNQEFKTSIKK